MQQPQTSTPHNGDNKINEKGHIFNICIEHKIFIPLKFNLLTRKIASARVNKLHSFCIKVFRFGFFFVYLHKYSHNGMIKRVYGNVAIVILFALLHFAVAIISRMLDYYDDIPLTILTITMVIIVAMRNNTRVEMMAIITLVATLLGFLIGSWFLEPMSKIVNNQYLAPAISTFLITTILGVLTNYITRRTKRFRSYNPTWRPRAGSILFVAGSILVIRMLYAVLFRAGIFTEGMLLGSIADIMGNTWAILIILAGNIILTMRIRLLFEDNSRSKRVITALLVVGTILLSLGASLIIYFDIPHFIHVAHGSTEYIKILSATLLVDMLAATVCFLFHLSIASKQELKQEREEKHRTEYQYERLKQQINPHFLFNSLGILDYLVQEQETERASAFIRKLANIYRYMLNNDQKPLVKLSEELDFTTMYIDLLKERFVEGMVIEIEIEEREKSGMVVPCSLQLLVENATKHNIVSAEMPLTLTIRSEGGLLIVTNNLQLRTHGQPSTHLGLANIRRQYLDITGRDIVVEKSENEFRVKLPIV